MYTMHPCRYKDCKYPENMDTLQINNTSLDTIEAEFYFQKDHNGTTFLLDPPTMTLEAGQTEVCSLLL